MQFAVFSVDFRDILKERAESGLYTGLDIGLLNRILYAAFRFTDWKYRMMTHYQSAIQEHHFKRLLRCFILFLCSVCPERVKRYRVASKKGTDCKRQVRLPPTTVLIKLNFPKPPKSILSCEAAGYNGVRDPSSFKGIPAAAR